MRVGPQARLLLADVEQPVRGTLDLTGEASIDSVRGTISVDSGFIEPIRGHRLQKWVVEAEPSSRVRVLAESTELDVVLYVVLGESVLYSGDDGRGTDNWLEFAMPDGDDPTYILVGSHGANAEGEYRLRGHRRQP